MFCSGCEHYVRECPVAAQYLQQGKIAKNDAGKLVLPDGRYVPRNVPGRNMQERVDKISAITGEPHAMETRDVGRVQGCVLE